MLKSGETCQRCGVIKLSGDGVCSYCSELVYTQADIDKAVADEREACAQVCDDLSTDYWADYKTGENRADPRFEGLSDGADICAEAIRNRGKELVDE